jgi:hypothetical protein
MGQCNQDLQQPSWLLLHLVLRCSWRCDFVPNLMPPFIPDVSFSDISCISIKYQWLLVQQLDG